MVSPGIGAAEKIAGIRGRGQSLGASRLVGVAVQIYG